MKVQPEKILRVIFATLFYLVILLYNIFDKSGKITSGQLEVFYAANLDSCKIENIKSEPYPDGRGTYRLFRTDCSSNYFPILLKDRSLNSETGPFQLETIIFKTSNSNIAHLINSGKSYQIEFISSKEERLFQIKPTVIILSGFYIILLVLSLVLPPRLTNEVKRNKK